jgi:nucleoside-diphosphate-sugar epimerase
MRFSLVYGPGDKSTAQMVGNALHNPRFGEGTTADFPHQYLHVDDAAEALLRAGFMDSAANEIFTIAGGDNTSHRDISRLARRAQGTRQANDLIPDRSRLWRRYDQPYDIVKAHRTLDFFPAVSMEEGIVRLVEASGGKEASTAARRTAP